MAKTRYCFRHEFIDHHLSASFRSPHDLLRQINGGVASELRVHVQQNSVVFHSAGYMQFADTVVTKLVEKRGNVESMVMRVAFEIVGIQNQPASGSIRQLIKKSSFGISARTIRNDMNRVLEQEGNSVALLNRADPLADHVESLFCLGHGQHDTQMFTIDLGVREMLAVPRHIDLFQKIVEQTEVGRRPSFMRADRQTDAMYDNLRFFANVL